EPRGRARGPGCGDGAFAGGAGMSRGRTDMEVGRWRACSLAGKWKAARGEFGPRRASAEWQTSAKRQRTCEHMGAGTRDDAGGRAGNRFEIEAGRENSRLDGTFPKVRGSRTRK